MRRVCQFWMCGIVMLVVVVLVAEVKSIKSSQRHLQRQSVFHNPQHIFQDPSPLKLFSSHVLTVTAYTDDPAENAGCPKTASGSPLVVGGVAVSRDLKRRGWTFGRRVHIHGLGVFEINDVMAPRHTKTLDVFVTSKKEAFKIGRSHMVVTLLPHSES